MTITYHRLTLVERGVSRTADKHVVSRWSCECGNIVAVAHSRVKNGATKSCGCLAKDVSSATATKHGGCGSPEYSSWIAMRRRCLSPVDKDYPRYGGLRITICPEWSDFATFLNDMGPRPAGMTLDRIDGALGYEPGNVRWATAKVQGRNRRGTFQWNIRGRAFGSITEAAEAFSVSEQTVHRWVNGAVDARRGTTIAPRPDCTVEERYA